MGMDVYGKMPQLVKERKAIYERLEVVKTESERESLYAKLNDLDENPGAYFRNNCWWWRPLWDYVCQTFPWVGEKVQHGHSNDGDGLDAEDSLKLAKLLQEELDSGRTEKFAAEREKETDALPDEVCWVCDGTGKRALPPNVGPGPMPCNNCEGKGKVRPMSTHYPFSVENVQDFQRFLANCGGFEIC